MTRVIVGAPPPLRRGRRDGQILPEATRFAPDGTLAATKIATLTAIIKGYEKEQARVCGTYPQCSTDDGTFAAFVDTPERLVSGHLTIAGHVEEATLMWPKAQPLLP